MGREGLITLGVQTRVINFPDLFTIEEFLWALNVQCLTQDKKVTLMQTKGYAEYE